MNWILTWLNSQKSGNQTSDFIVPHKNSHSSTVTIVVNFNLISITMIKEELLCGEIRYKGCFNISSRESFLKQDVNQFKEVGYSHLTEQ